MNSSGICLKSTRRYDITPLIDTSICFIIFITNLNNKPSIYLLIKEMSEFSDKSAKSFIIPIPTAIVHNNIFYFD